MATPTQEQTQVPVVDNPVQEQLRMIQEAVQKRSAAQEAVDKSMENLKATKKAHKTLVDRLEAAEEELKLVSANV